MASKQSRSIFNSGTLFGDPDLQNLIQHIDDLNFSLSKKSNLDSQYQDDSVKLNDILSLLSTEEKIPGSTDQTSETSIQHLLKDLAIPIQRQNRYRVYDEIYSSVQIIKRIISVYSNNILQKDIITGKCLSLLENKDNSANPALDSITDVKSFCNVVIKHFDIENKLTSKIINNLLKYGDCYIEIIDLKQTPFNLPDPKSKPEDNPTSSTLLTENLNKLKTINKTLKINGENSINYLSEQLADVLFDLLIETEDQIDNYEELLYENSFIDDLFDKDSKPKKPLSLKEFKKNTLNRFILRIHSPKKILNLTTQNNDTTLGYVEVQEKESIEKVPGVGLQFATILKQISTVTKDKTQDISRLTQQIVKRLISKIIQKTNIHKNINNSKKSPKEINLEFEKQLNSKLGDELFFLIKKLFDDSGLTFNGLNNSKLNVRYIPPGNMISLTLNPNEYYPYGTSIIDPLVYPAKLYLLTQLTNMVIKLSRASLIRKWTKLLSLYIVICIENYMNCWNKYSNTQSAAKLEIT